MGTIYKSGINYSGGGGGDSLPDGGTTGQALIKKSDVDQDVEWGDAVAQTPTLQEVLNQGNESETSISIKDASDSQVIAKDSNTILKEGASFEWESKRTAYQDILGVKNPSTGDYVTKMSIDVQNSSTPVIDMTNNVKQAWRTALGITDGGSIQVETLPDPNSVLEGATFQYVGNTTAEYTNGYFYQCDFDIPTSKRVWKRIDVQPASGGSSTIGRWEKIAEYTTSTTFSKDLSAYEMIALTANPDTNVSGDAAMMLTSELTDGKSLQANGYAGKQAVLTCTTQGEYTLALNGSTVGASIFGYTTDKLSQQDQDAIASKVQITGKIVRDGDELWAGVASSGTLVLSNDITNYGELHFEFQTSTSRQSAVFKVSDITIGESNPTYGFLLGNYGVWGYFTDASHFIISTGSGITIRKIYGYKYTGIGAVGVPDGGVKNQALVKKSDVDGDVGWKYVDATAPVTQTKAVLWSGSATSEIITLADSLENYDMLEFAYANGGRWSSYGTDSPVITRSIYIDDWATDGHVVFGETIGSGNVIDETWVRVSRTTDPTKLQVSNHLNSSYSNRFSSLIRVYGVKFEEANVLTAPNGTKYRIKVANDGTLTTEAI